MVGEVAEVAKCRASKVLRSMGEDFWRWGGEAGSLGWASVTTARAGWP